MRRLERVENSSLGNVHVLDGVPRASVASGLAFGSSQYSLNRIKTQLSRIAYSEFFQPLVTLQMMNR
jgi:hypothetical protein